MKTVVRESITRFGLLLIKCYNAVSTVLCVQHTYFFTSETFTKDTHLNKFIGQILLIIIIIIIITVRFNNYFLFISTLGTTVDTKISASESRCSTVTSTDCYILDLRNTYKCVRSLISTGAGSFNPYRVHGALVYQ